jgi:hypothetical protein
VSPTEGGASVESATANEIRATFAALIATPAIEKLRALIDELFLLDEPDLDFGLYRVMTASPNPDRTFTRLDLYTARYTTDPARLRRRHVGRLTHLTSYATDNKLGSGHYAFLSADAVGAEITVTIVRLSDGAYWRLYPGDGYRWGADSPVWVAHGEIALTRGFLVAPQLPQFRMLQRIRLDSLAPPEGFLRPD